MYTLLEASLGDLSRLYQYKLEGCFQADFSLKGFDYPWIIKSHAWQPGEKVLDVGAGYSPLPLHIQQIHAVEMWAADDYGLDSEEPFWERNASPHEYISNHPEIRFVVERLGESEKSSLPKGYFDVIYSASALEHVAYLLTPKVWKHMDQLLKIGGEMIHAIDIPFPSNGGVEKIIQAIGFDALHRIIPNNFKLRHHLATPKTYVHLVMETIGIESKSPKDLSVLNMVLNPDVLSESYAYGLNRILKDKMANYRY
jgi:ubiquinone/menaquinone biosynthesis C-methylase UbiE